MTDTEPRFLAVVGPTASGKTSLALELARRGPAEVISVDSRQVYRGMDIGTDKVGAAARAEVPHHGLDLVEPDARYSAGRFARDARSWIEEIRRREALPILAGGTGFFLRSVMEPLFQEPPMEPGRRRALRAWLADREPDDLARWVRRLDPGRADVAVEGGPQRMSRTVEVALLTGVPLSVWHEKAPADAAGVPGLVVVLEVSRDELDRRIDARVGTMVDRGLVDEVRRLMQAGYDEASPGMTGTGYREVARYLRGESSLEEAMEQMRRRTRQYARRQLTWFRNQLAEDHVRISADQPVPRQADAVVEAMAEAEMVWPGTPGLPGAPVREDEDEGGGT